MKDISAYTSQLDKNFQYFSVFCNERMICHAYLSYSQDKRRVFFLFLELTHRSIKTTHILSLVCCQIEMLPQQNRAAPRKFGIEIECSAGIEKNASVKYTKPWTVLATVYITLSFFAVKQVGVAC